ncbi:MAG: DUF31 family protein [Mycoplasmataceae bacterium]|nr:DUF31 family protein [Mycoplasmataceae bacterium]
MKKYKNLFIGLTLPISLTLLPIIVSCKDNKTKVENNVEQEILNKLEQEVTRVNNLKIILKKTSLFKNELNEKNLLSNIYGFNAIDNFNYSINSFQDNGKSIKFKIEISLDSSSNIYKNSKLSKEFSFNYDDLTPHLLQEKNRLNELTTNLPQQTFLQSQIDSMNENNVLNYIRGITFDKVRFNYEIFNFNKSQNNIISFNIRVFFIINDSSSLETNQFNFNYQISDQLPDDDTTTKPTNPSSSISQEKIRLESQKPTFINSNITYQELVDINIENLLDKVTNLNLDKTNFKYVVNILEKNLNNSSKIHFNIVVANKNDEDFKYYENYVFFDLKYTLVKEDKKEEVKTNYFQNNATPITNGSQYALSTPGTNGEDINLFSGSFQTKPGDDVIKDFQQSKSIVYNQTEVNQLKNTFSLGFTSHGGGTGFGTGWILDYKLTEDNTYPTTWYFATNSHVIHNLKVKNDTITPDRYEIENEAFHNTKEVCLETVKNPQIGKEFGTSLKNPNNFIRKFVPADKVKTIFIGNDFLTTSPKNFTNNSKWQDMEEYIDFAVMEVTFSSPEEAKEITQDYVSDTSRHFKYKKESLLKNPNNIKENNFSILGFPTLDNNSYWRETQLMSSRPADKDNKPLVEQDKLTSLSKSNYYKNFEGINHGIIDAAIGLSYLTYIYRQNYSLSTTYTQWGLMYASNYADLGAGSSGSMLMDKDGYTWGIHFGGDNNAQVGISVALYCEGFNYGGRFGKYNLEGYDLIEGGFPNQKTSYKQNLKKLYGQNIKTKLFPNGLN